MQHTLTVHKLPLSQYIWERKKIELVLKVQSNVIYFPFSDRADSVCQDNAASFFFHDDIAM